MEYGEGGGYLFVYGMRGGDAEKYIKAVGLAWPFPRKETMLNWSSFLHKFIDILELDVRLYQH